MRYLTAGITGVLLAFSLAVLAIAQEKDRPVQAKEPTVVTVRGKAEAVEPDERKPQQKGGALRTIARGPVWLGKRIADWLDFNVGGDNVVPSEREKREKEKTSRK
jgi:hypothetical protein